MVSDYIILQPPPVLELDPMVDCHEGTVLSSAEA